ncbi:hypothetical protein [Streptomyces alboflavus]|uniref:hypothetical protein n=1 Tax=Streptomyces alboflavus TaxID=67267 RepID=UPI0004C1A057|nr:hypothetical protein [Streptomyces alboflavus]
MRHRAPPPTPGVLAPHIPADTYRRAQATGEPIILVHPVPTVPAAPRRTARGCLIAVGVVIAGGIGGMGLVVAFLALLDIAAHTATAIGGALGIGGITVKLTRPKTK